MFGIKKTIEKYSKEHEQCDSNEQTPYGTHVSLLKALPKTVPLA